MTDEEKGHEEGKDDSTAQDGTDDKGTGDGSKSTDQSSSDTSKDEGGKQGESDSQSSSDQGKEGEEEEGGGSGHDAAEAKKSYDNLLGVSQAKSQTIKEKDAEIARLKAGKEGDDGSPTVQEQVQHELLIQRRSDTNLRVLSDPKVKGNGALLSEMETVLAEQPDLKNLANGMEMARDIAKGRLSDTQGAADREEREKDARGEENDAAKDRASGHKQGASRRLETSDTDRVESTKEMTPEQRDEYARKHSFED